MNERRRVTLAFTGASGAPYGLRLLQCLLQADAEVYVILSKAARVVMGMETDLRLPAGTGKTEAALRAFSNTEQGRLIVCGLEQWTAPVASGSGAPASMVVCPRWGPGWSRGRRGGAGSLRPRCSRAGG